MSGESLYPEVTRAIREAERLADAGHPDAFSAFAEVSNLEERISQETKACEVEGAISRRGAVRAAIASKNAARARALAKRYIEEPDATPQLRQELAEFVASLIPKQVVRRTEPGRVGSTTGRTRLQAGIVLVEVAWGVNQKEFVPESALVEFDPNAGSSSEFDAGAQFGRAEDLRRVLTFEKLRGCLHDFLYTAIP